MASRTLLLPLALAALAPLPFVACHSETADDASTDSGVADAATDTGETFVAPEPDTGPTVHCTLDNGSDPVALCLQKHLIESALESAFVKAVGVASSVDSTTNLPDVDGSGKMLHSVQDDVAFTALLARYLQDSTLYGDNEISVAVLTAFFPLLGDVEAEIATPPATYDGAYYFDLRGIAGYLRVLNYTSDADKLDAAADAYGRQIFDRYYHALSSPPGGDAGANDGGDATTPVGDGILGEASGSGFAYTPDAAASGAFALVDLAVRASSDAKAASWRAAAAAVLAHIHTRARDAATGLYLASLVTSSAGNDTPVATSLPSDALLTAVQASIAATLVKMRSFLDQHPAPELAAFPFETRAEDLVNAVNGTTPSLWDATAHGYYEGYVPSTSKLLDDKPTAANAAMLTALHYTFLGGQGPHADRILPLHDLLTKTSPANSSFVSVIPDQHGYFATVPANFSFPVGDAGAAGARSYVTSTFALVTESLHDQLAQPQ